MRNIAIIRDSFVFENIILSTDSTPDRIWKNINTVFPSISSIGVYDSKNKEIFFRSKNNVTRVPTPNNLENGIVTRSKKGAFSMLQTRKDFIQNKKQIYTVIGVLLP